MIIANVTVQNFRSYGEASIDLPQQGLTIIQGVNGAGKSSIVSAAVLWCLYGETPDGVAVKELRRQGSNENDPTSVTVTLHVEGREIIVYRALKGKNLTTIAEVTVDGAPMTDVKSGAATAFVESTLGVDATGFKTAYLVQQKSLDSLVRQTAAVRKKTIEKLSGIERLAAAVDEARSSARSLQKIANSYETSDKSIETLQGQVRVANQILVDVLTEQSEVESTLQSLEASHEVAVAAARKAESVARGILTAKAAYDVAESAVLNARNAAERGETELSEAGNELAEARAKMSTITAEWTYGGDVVVTELGDKQQRLGALRSERERLTNLIESLGRDEDKACPTCGQKADTATIKRDTEKNLASVINEGKTLKAEVERITVANEIAGKIRDTQQEVLAKEARVHGIQKQLQETLSRRRDAEEKFAAMTLVEHDESVVQTLNQTEQTTKAKLDSARKIAGECARKVSAAERDVMIAENSLTKEEENTARRKTALAEYELAVALTSALERFRSQRIAALAPALSESASDYLSILTDGTLVSLELTDDFEPLVTSSDGTSRPVAMLSGGEESVVALALRLAIGDEVIEGAGSLLVLDEILGALDDTRRSLVTRTLRDLGRQVVLVHHGETEFADASFTVVQSDDGATVEAD
jgi:DNA repair exonuclease SbcCD ATPase subunit